MNEDPWSALADRFVEGAYATAKGRVRTHVMHRHLMEHLPPAPATVLDVGGGAGNQSLPLAREGYRVTILDSSAAMLDKARQRMEHETPEVRERIRLIQAAGEDAASATGDQFDAVLCHGVLMYLDDPQPMLDALTECVLPGGLVSVMALNAKTLAVLPALEHRWRDALAAFNTAGERGVLGVDTRADTVENLTARLAPLGIEVTDWYGVWLFTDWMDIGTDDPDELAAVADVELQASRQDPYRRLSRVFHLIGRKR